MARVRASQVVYPVVGALLGLGAPLGFRLLERALGRRKARFARGRAAYAYMALTTPVVFALYGRVLGQRERAVQEAHRQLTRLRDEFAAVVAHDLRNPIQTILLEADILRRKATSTAEGVPPASVDRVARSAERLGVMVNDLLDASRVEASRLRLDPRPVDLAQAVRQIVERLRPTLKQHPVEVSAEGPSPVVRADPGRLDQILTNLIDNACKFSPAEAPITLHVRARDGGGAVIVEDRGMGIAPEELGRLFDRFYQTGRARAHKTGLGLGLYITRGLVEAHGGRINVTSEVGRGSAFEVWLPPGEGHIHGAAPDRR